MVTFLNTRLKETARIEFWIVICCLSASLIFDLIDISRSGQGTATSAIINGVPVPAFPRVGSAFSAALFNHIITLISYLMLCFYVTPAFESPDEKASNSVFVFAFITVCFLAGIINVHFTALLAIKILFIFFGRNRLNKQNGVYYEVALLTISLLLIRTVITYMSIPLWLYYYVIYNLPLAFLMYLYVVYVLMPKSITRKRPFLYYLPRLLLGAILSTSILYGVCLCFKNTGNELIGQLPQQLINQLTGFNLWPKPNDEQIVIILATNFFSVLLIVSPLARSIYKRRHTTRDEEIKVLKTELGKTDANLNFLKSQINPHFLFNALNTLFGTALQENAERTSEGIQKLGDMMRFMLQENMQDKILLSRDIDYLKNYILLQKLRTSTSEDVTIEVQIEEQHGELLIAPMLLIPFVENAFKHGISLQNPSHIKVTLQISGNTMYFDVHNSIHIRNEDDPEKGHSGVGLENVKQRLALIYPQKHDLIIRNNIKDFFIHLTLQLETNS
jgi:two-component system LytT family sensor kinase